MAEADYVPSAIQAGNTEASANPSAKPRAVRSNRRYFIGGSDARIIMGNDEAALLRLWREKRGESRAGGPVRQPHRPARGGDRGPQPALVRGQYRAGHHRHPAAGPASGDPLDGGHPRRPGRRQRRRVRSQVHAALVVLGGGGRRKIHAAAAAQHVGGCGEDRRCSR